MIKQGTNSNERNTKSHSKWSEAKWRISQNDRENRIVIL